MAEPQTYAELQATLLAWLEEDADTINPTECIGLAERRLNRLLTVPDMESITTLDASTDTIALPADFWEVRDVYVNISPRLRLEPVSLAVLRDSFASNRTSKPTMYALSAGSMMIAPTPDAAYSIVLTYKASIPSLSDANPTNWLLTKHPDLYVAASLAMAEFRGWNDARLPMLKGWYDELIGEVNEAGQRSKKGAGPLRMRAYVTDSNVISPTAASGDVGNEDQFLVDG